MTTKKKTVKAKTWTCPDCNIIHPKAYTYCGGCKGEKDCLSARDNHQKQAAAAAEAKAAKVKADTKAALSPKAASGADVASSPSPKAPQKTDQSQVASPKVASPKTPPQRVTSAPHSVASDDDSAEMKRLKSEELCLKCAIVWHGRCR